MRYENGKVEQTEKPGDPFIQSWLNLYGANEWHIHQFMLHYEFTLCNREQLVFLSVKKGRQQRLMITIGDIRLGTVKNNKKKNIPFFFLEILD